MCATKLEKTLQAAGKEYDVAFVTVNYNTCDLTKQLLQFLRTAALPFSYKLVVVDNNSKDGSHEFLSAQDDIVYIQAGENLGYGKAINRGIVASQSRYICVLNTDVILNSAALIALWDHLEKNADVGVVSPLVTNQDGSIQGFIFYKTTMAIIFNILNKIRTSLIKRKLAGSTTPQQVDGVLGAFFLIRRSVATSGKLFDEDFFFYFEDTDLAHRLCDAGIKCHVLPGYSIIHLGGSSTSLQAARIFFKSKSIYLKKHYGDSFAGLIARLDKLRLAIKLIKYRFLSAFIKSPKIISKRDYYASMQQALEFSKKRS